MTVDTKLEDESLILLPKAQIIIRPSYDGIHIVASLFRRGRFRDWDKYRLSDLPNKLISLDDLKRFGVDLADVKACGGQVGT